MNLSVGILTQVGGFTSHAAVVARGLNKTCVVGCTTLDLHTTSIAINGKSYKAGDSITIDGSTGNV